VTEDVEAVGALSEPARRALYEYVAAAHQEVSRNEAAEAVGVSRPLAAFHLDRLVDVGLLEASFRRLTGRSGPGAGRPAKLYRRAAGERSVSLPPRAYRTAAELLAEAVEEAGADTALHESARRYGRHVAAAVGPEPIAALGALGYEPADTGDRVLLRNCPYHPLARQFPPLVCGMNLALVEGLLAGLDGDEVARMDPAPDRCCVVLLKQADVDLE
jgi:predicted ArsR family transcriptional regulator